MPKYEKGELWSVNNVPLLDIEVSFSIAKKKKEDKKKSKKVSATPDSNTIKYKPDLEKCTSFFDECLQMIITSTNDIHILEDELMPFINNNPDDPKKPNFELSQENAWIVEAKENLAEILKEELQGPKELMEKYKKFEYVLNEKKRDLSKQLINNENKATLDEIKDKINHYDNAAYEIMNLSNDVEDFPLFRI
jgi:hypothetical protein